MYIYCPVVFDINRSLTPDILWVTPCIMQQTWPVQTCTFSVFIFVVVIVKVFIYSMFFFKTYQHYFAFALSPLRLFLTQLPPPVIDLIWVLSASEIKLRQFAEVAWPVCGQGALIRCGDSVHSRFPGHCVMAATDDTRGWHTSHRGEAGRWGEGTMPDMRGGAGHCLTARWCRILKTPRVWVCRVSLSN